MIFPRLTQRPCSGTIFSRPTHRLLSSVLGVWYATGRASSSDPMLPEWPLALVPLSGPCSVTPSPNLSLETPASARLSRSSRMPLILAVDWAQILAPQSCTSMRMLVHCSTHKKPKDAICLCKVNLCILLRKTTSLLFAHLGAPVRPRNVYLQWIHLERQSAHR